MMPPILLSFFDSITLSKSDTVSPDTLIAITGVLIAVIALLISIRLQILTLVDSQLIELAKTCNSYLQDDYQAHNRYGVIGRGRASGIVTSLEDARNIIEYYNSVKRFIFKSDIVNFKTIFYHHLHSSIKVILKDVLINKGDGFRYWTEEAALRDSNLREIDIYDPIRKDQLNNTCAYFHDQINATWDFEKNREKRLKIQ